MDRLGFLAEPDERGFSHQQNEHLRTLDDLDPIPCVLALGDPGLGKSWEVEAYVTRLAERVRASEIAGNAGAVAAILDIDATEIDSRDALRANVFDAPAFQEWRSRSGILHLIIDSFDEARIPLPLLSDLFVDGLEDVPVERLRLRIACRTAVVPTSLRDGLRRRFLACYPSDSATATEDRVVPIAPPNEASAAPSSDHSRSSAPAGPYAEVEIALLTRENARSAASARLEQEQDPERFLQEVYRAGAGAFAARPQTLFALIERFRHGQTLAASQLELFESLCRQLADPKPVRPATVDLTPHRTTREQRYHLAGRISAAMLLGNRPSLWLGETAPAGEAILDVSDLSGSDYIQGEHVSADETRLWEAVNTGLFTGAGENGLAAHLTFAEFLTATWITVRQLPMLQLVPLLREPTDPDGRVVPQLRQVAAWLAAMRNDVFDSVALTEPDILLWSDVVELPVAKRPALVASLVEGTTANRLENPPFGMWRPLHRLAHPALAEQLTPVITDRSLPHRTRDLAFDIAYACELSGTTPLAAQVALDESEPLDLRVAAARVVAQAGGEVERRTLITLARTPPDIDVADDLKGEALRASWRLLAPNELYAIVTRPRRANYSGSYGRALDEIAEGITGEYAHAGAVWLASAAPEGIHLDHLVAATFRVAVDASDDNKVLRSLALYALKCMRQQHPVLDGVGRFARDLRTSVQAYLEGSVELRRRLLSATLAAAATVRPPPLYYFLTEDEPRLFHSADVVWGFSQLTALPPSDDRRSGWIEVIKRVFNPTDRGHVTAAFEHRDDPDVAQATFGLTATYATPDEALEGVAARQREYERRQAQWAEQRASAERRRESKRAAARISLAERLNALEPREDSQATWARIVTEILRDDDGDVRGHLEEDTIGEIGTLRVLPLAHQLADRAVAYLRDADVPDDPFPDGAELWLVIFGFVACVCLFELAPEKIDQLSDEVWSKWTRAFVGHFAYRAEEAAHTRIVQRAALADPARVRGELLALVDRYAAREHPWIPDTALSAGLEIPGFADELAARIGAGAYDARLLTFLLAPLLQRQLTAGLDAARTLLARRSRKKEDRERALAAGAELLAHAPGPAWSLLWQRLTSSDDAARAQLEYAARTRELIPRSALDELNDEQVADLYLLVARLYPIETDPWHTGVFSPGIRDNLQQWREGLLRALESRKSLASVAQLERIARQEPTRDYLVQIWLRAKTALRGDLWRGTSPRELMRLAERRDLRLAESGSQLLDVLLESLARLQQDLQGQWRSVVGLWNEDTAGNTPKREEHLSNEIARHLARDLAEQRLVIGRELVLQIGVLGAAEGLRTDIDVVANAAPGTNRSIEQLRVVIEVKASWNPEVLTAMEQQLVKKYLQPHRIRHGLYLVGDYTCGSWKAGRQRQRSQALGGRSALTKILAEQAQSLTTPLLEVRSLVLDTSLPDAPGKRIGEKKRGRR